ncbi:MAG: EF-P lysine aminoacylase EpmA [Pseudomonadota bacterium]
MNTTSDWRPAATQTILEARAQLLAAVRQFFAVRGVLEVETPVLSTAAATAPHLESFVTRYSGPHAAHGVPLYLQTSPEFAMKRLLAAGSGPIYQICKAFRNGEAGRRHNPEFTMLEWYRPGFDHHTLMDEVEELVTSLLAERITQPAERLSYAAAFQRYAELDPHQATSESLRACAAAHGVADTPDLAALDRDAWLDLLLTHVVGPRLGRERLCFIHDYPATQAALARVRRDTADHAVAERFELYAQGMELASGYHELSDGAEQRARFAEDNAKRRAQGRDVPLDERLLAALSAGLPPCAGVALGVDRLLMLKVGARDINEVLSFPISRA